MIYVLFSLRRLSSAFFAVVFSTTANHTIYYCGTYTARFASKIPEEKGFLYLRGLYTQVGTSRASEVFLTHHNSSTDGYAATTVCIRHNVSESYT